MIKKVTEILSEKHSIIAQPGKGKIQCPYCGKKTLSVKPDNTIAKCFHPNCGKAITQWQGVKSFYGELNQIFGEICQALKEALMSLKDKKGKNAYLYLRVERNIDPRVIKDSNLGAVPSHIDLHKYFSKFLKKMEKSLNKEGRKGKGKPGRPPNLKKKKIENKIALLKDFENTLSCYLKIRVGWLCLIYTDETGRFTAIRFREPYSKNIRLFKPFTNLGVFGLQLFKETPSNTITNKDNQLLVVEGEVNQLQIQSLVLRKSKKSGGQDAYINAVAVGAVTGADLGSIKKINVFPIICYDNDISGAGFTLVQKTQKIMSCRAITTPKPDSDLDEYILSFEGDHNKAWIKIQQLIKKAKRYTRSFDSALKEINQIRRKDIPWKNLKPFEINRKVAERIKADFLERGRFYQDGCTVYYFSDEQKELIEVNVENKRMEHLLEKYGLNAAENPFIYVLRYIHINFLFSGKRIDVKRIAFYKRSKNTQYIFNNENKIFRITPDKIHEIDNGTDGVVFLSDPNYQKLEIENSNSKGSLIDRFIISKVNFDNSALTIKEKRLIFTIWFLSLFFESIMNEKPLLTLIGERGSGKTMALKRIGYLFKGKKFNVTSLPDKESDFDAIITNNYFAVIDNVDTGRKWLPDKLAVCATGGNVPKRVLFTTNEHKDYPIKCSLGLTCKSLKFGRDDVIERLLPLAVKKQEGKKSASYFIRQVLNNRKQILHEVFQYLQEVLEALKGHQKIEASDAYRIADFYDFAVKIGKYAGIEKQIKTIFIKLVDEQTFLELNREPTFNLLLDWAEKNKGQEITSTNLCKELSYLADQKRLPFEFKGLEKPFAHRLAQMLPQLEVFFDITQRTGGGRKRFYTFKPKV